MSNFLSRYILGDAQGVWHELQSIGASTFEDTTKADVEAVVRETIVRVKASILMIVERVIKLGYEFEHNSNEGGAGNFVPHNPIQGLGEDRVKEITLIERSLGYELPLIYREFLLQIGGVDLRGRHQAWAEEYADALVVEPLSFEIFEEEREMQEEEWEEQEQPGAFLLAFSPDAFHKENVSGGLPYALELRPGLIDTPVREMSFEGTFLEYLREAMSYGGFPRWSSMPSDLRTSLTQGLPVF